MTAPVLVVEDDLSFREALRRWLETLGHSCVLTESAEQAASEFPKQLFSAVLLDLNLPDINGDEVLKLLRADPATSAIPVVILSADATQIERLLLLGAIAYLTKPLDVRNLEAIVDELIGPTR